MDLIRVNHDIQKVVERMETILNKMNNQSAMGANSVDPKFGSRAFSIRVNPDTFDLSLLNKDEWQLLVDDFNRLRDIEKNTLKELYGENQANKALAGQGGYGNMQSDFYQNGYY